MPFRPPIVLLTAVLLTLAACEEPMTTTTVLVAPERPAVPATPSPPRLPTFEPIDVETLGSDPISGLPDPAVSTCMSEVAQASGEGTVAPVSVEDGTAGQTITIAAGEERAIWQCRVDASGEVSVAQDGA